MSMFLYFKEKIDAMETISFEDLRTLIEAFIYGTATPMIALIKVLRYLFANMKRGSEYRYFDQNGDLKKLGNH